MAWVEAQSCLRVSLYIHVQMFTCFLHAPICQSSHHALKKLPHSMDNLTVEFKQSSRVLFELGYTLHWTNWIKSAHYSKQRHWELYRMILARCILSLAGYGPWERKAFLTERPAQGKLWEQDWQTQRTAMKKSGCILLSLNGKDTFYTASVNAIIVVLYLWKWLHGLSTYFPIGILLSLINNFADKFVQCTNNRFGFPGELKCYIRSIKYYRCHMVPTLPLHYTFLETFFSV